MNLNDLCDGKTKEGKIPAIWKKATKKQAIPGLGWCWFTGAFRPKWIKRPRMRCPKCGRRLVASVELEHDGLDLIFSIPPHKPKKWWKKPKKRNH